MGILIDSKITIIFYFCFLLWQNVKEKIKILLLMQNSIYKMKYLLFLSWDWEAWCLTVWGLGGVVFDSVWG